MKKKIFLLIMIMSFVLPMKVLASTYYDDYKTLNLVGALQEEEIPLENTNYKETNDQAIIYLFRGNGCGFCRKLLTYLSSLTKDYGKYFKVVSFEVWNDASNNALMQKIAGVTGVAAQGVPYYIIGDETFDGYAESYNERIVNAIMNEYNNPSPNADVFNKLEEKENGTSSKSGGADTFAIIFWNFVVIAAATGLVIYFNDKNKKEIINYISENKKTEKYDKKNKNNKEKE